MSEIESEALKRLEAIQARLIETTPQLKESKSSKGRILDSFEKSRPTTSNSKKKRELTGSKTSELENKVQELKKQIEKERETREQMQRDMKAREDRYSRRESEYRKTLLEYEAELRARSKYTELPINLQFDRNYHKVDKLHNQINSNISNMQKKTADILSEQEKDIKRQFETRIKEVDKELEEEKQKKLEGAGTYMEKESKLTMELELIKSSMEFIESKNAELQKENFRILKEYREQESLRKQTLKEIVDVKRENAQLMEELAKYTEFSVSVNLSRESSVFSPPKQKAMKSTGFRASSFSVEDEKATRYESIINKLKRMLELERRNLKAVRSSYSKEIQNKTELEQILRKCVDEVMAKYVVTEELDSHQREEVIEMMLSQERVISLLYDQTFPSRGVTTQNFLEEELS